MIAEPVVEIHEVETNNDDKRMRELNKKLQASSNNISERLDKFKSLNSLAKERYKKPEIGPYVISGDLKLAKLRALVQKNNITRSEEDLDHQQSRNKLLKEME